MKYLLISELAAIVAWIAAYFAGAMGNPFAVFAPFVAIGAGIVASAIETFTN